MKSFYLFFTSFIYITSIQSQSIVVGGQCMSGPIVLNQIDTLVYGKPAYEGFGNVQENDSVQVDILWLTAPDSVWVLSFGGQPYFSNSCNTAIPPSTANTSCTWVPVTGQSCTGAVPLSIDGTGVLPVRITSFTAVENNKVINLNWKTALEINNKLFDIEKSGDGVRWDSIGSVKGSLNSSVEKSYSFTDALPFAGKNIYRLLQVDIDNRGVYSSIVSVNFLKQGFYSLSNNPGNGLYKLYIQSTTDRLDISVFDGSGRKILGKNNLAAGVETIDISSSPAGLYFLQIQKGTQLFSEKLIHF